MNLLDLKTFTNDGAQIYQTEIKVKVKKKYLSKKNKF